MRSELAVFKILTYAPSNKRYLFAIELRIKQATFGYLFISQKLASIIEQHQNILNIDSITTAARESSTCFLDNLFIDITSKKVPAIPSAPTNKKSK